VTPTAPTQPAPQNPNVDRERARVAKLLEEAAALAEQDIPPPAFYGELLKKLLDALLAPAGAIWLVSPQGTASPLCQINLKEVGLDERPEAAARQQVRASLVQMVLNQARPTHVMPNTLLGEAADGQAPPGNPTDFILLTVPLIANGQVTGLVEVWQRPNRPTNAIPGFLQFIGLMAEVASRYQRNQKMGSLLGQQQLWIHLEQFARQVHGTLNPLEAAYLVANDGRRLIECDRVSVALRYGNNVQIEAVSGADVVEKRSNQMRLLRLLCDAVLQWGEKLVFRGVRDDGLPPRVLDALDAYLGESHSRLLVIQPLRDERQKDATQPARAAVVMECFDPPEDPTQLTNRLEIIARHATPALYNAMEYRRIPLRFLWWPLVKLQEGLGGQTRAIWMAVFLALTALGSVFYFVPYPLKLDSTGQLLPMVQRKIYTPITGQVKQFLVESGQVVGPGHDMVQLFDVNLATRIHSLQAEMASANASRHAAEAQAKLAANDATQEARYRKDAEQHQRTFLTKKADLDDLCARTGADRTNPGWFTIKAPEFTPEQLAKFSADVQARQGYRNWTVVNSGFALEYQGKEARPSDALLVLAARDGRHEIELRIPQKHIGQILKAYERLGTDTLDVDFLLRTHPTQPFKGKLHKNRVGGQVSTAREDGTEAEPFVTAYVSLDDPDIEADYRVPPEMLQAGTVGGTEISAKVRCGPHRLGYALFYGMWEFFYENVVFFF